MTSAGFDNISSVYDKLARLVYGKSIIEAQKHFLKLIPQQANVLILGGGTGWILTEIIKKEVVCAIWYVDASEEMIRLSKKRVDNSHIQFILGTENNMPSSVRFDIVITNFYLDLFPMEKLNKVIDKIIFVLRPESHWIVTDFIDTKKWWARLLLKSMYTFFGVLCKIEATDLPDWHDALQEKGLRKKESRFFYHGFIESAVYSVS